MIFPYAIEAHRHDTEIVREARLTMQALKLAREMETGPTPPAHRDHGRRVGHEQRR